MSDQYGRWYHRWGQVSDAILPPEKRLTRTNINVYTKDSPLIESGLLGPVTLQAEQKVSE